MSPSEFIDAAEKFLSAEFGEAGRRSAVSRAYYGAFHGCSRCLPVDLLPAREARYEAGSHKALVGSLEAWGNSTRDGRHSAQRAARKLARLRRARVDADYQLASRLTFDPSNCVRDAREVLSLVENARRLFDKAEDTV
ncbi:hypothetical protein LFL96_26775 [Paraburkholderia sp. D15]|uniref:hypothetical protein n=1 Tax=Paraburkholderia sp. D15 TaxID=2880218 RepID=UPI002479A7EE|nr:hypothetical protein [Paraburkholderia sp. D15]WGS54615.1 hypothetical protein LFL96_26775 [Paraburkholderia sp. D15]